MGHAAAAVTFTDRAKQCYAILRGGSSPPPLRGCPQGHQAGHDVELGSPRTRGTVGQEDEATEGQLSSPPNTELPFLHAPEARLARKMRPAQVPQMGRCSAANCRSSGMRPQRSATSAMVVLSPPAAWNEARQGPQHVGHPQPGSPQRPATAGRAKTQRQHATRPDTAREGAAISPGMISPATDCSSSLVRTCGTGTAGQHKLGSTQRGNEQGGDEVFCCAPARGQQPQRPWCWPRPRDLARAAADCKMHVPGQPPMLPEAIDAGWSAAPSQQAEGAAPTSTASTPGMRFSSVMCSRKLPCRASTPIRMGPAIATNRLVCVCVRPAPGRPGGQVSKRWAGEPAAAGGGGRGAQVPAH